MSIASSDTPVILIDSVEELLEAHSYLKRNRSKWDTVVVDSATDIAETCLAHRKRGAKDPRKAFYDAQEEVLDALRKFRDLKMNTYVIARHQVIIDAAGQRLNAPSMPSQKMSNDLPYIFDEVFAMSQDEDGDRSLLTELTPTWYAKDRSKVLSKVESPDLGSIFAKIETKIKEGKQDGKGKKGKKGKGKK